jgi:hypothetical protein
MLVLAHPFTLSQEVPTMNRCHVLHPEQAQGDYQVTPLEFWGNKPAVPPLTTETIASVVYLVDDAPAPESLTIN